MIAPDALRRRAGDLGFLVTGWSDDEGAIDGNGEVFVGTHREIEVFLAAWGASRVAVAREMSQDLNGYDMMTFSSRGDVVMPGSEYLFTRRPQRAPFLGLRLAIPDQIADRFDVGIRIGNRLEMEMTPGFVFAARADRSSFDLVTSAELCVRVEMSRVARTSFGGAIRIPSCQTAQDLSLVARNVSGPEHGCDGCEFSAVIIGVSPRARTVHGHL